MIGDYLIALDGLHRFKVKKINRRGKHFVQFWFNRKGFFYSSARAFTDHKAESPKNGFHCLNVNCSYVVTCLVLGFHLVRIFSKKQILIQLILHWGISLAIKKFYTRKQKKGLRNRLRVILYLISLHIKQYRPNAFILNRKQHLASELSLFLL